MLSLSQTTGYAVLALSCLEQSGRPVFAKDIAACTGIPSAYLSKILHSLTRSNLVISKRGFRGGFLLSRSAGAISVMDVAEAIEGPDCLPRCLLGLKDCEQERACPTHDFWARERQRIECELRRVRLSDVLKSTGTAGPERTAATAAQGLPFSARTCTGGCAP